MRWISLSAYVVALPADSFSYGILCHKPYTYIEFFYPCMAPAWVESVVLFRAAYALKIDSIRQTEPNQQNRLTYFKCARIVSLFLNLKSNKAVIHCDKWPFPVWHLLTIDCIFHIVLSLGNERDDYDCNSLVRLAISCHTLHKCVCHASVWCASPIGFFRSIACSAYIRHKYVRRSNVRRAIAACHIFPGNRQICIWTAWHHDIAACAHTNRNMTQSEFYMYHTWPKKMERREIVRMYFVWWSSSTIYWYERFCRLGFLR